MTVYTLITLICLNNGMCAYGTEEQVTAYTSYQMCAIQRDEVQAKVEEMTKGNPSIAYISTQCLIWGDEADA